MRDDHIVALGKLALVVGTVTTIFTCSAAIVALVMALGRLIGGAC